MLIFKNYKADFGGLIDGGMISHRFSSRGVHHIPVLVKEVVENLNLKPNSAYIDCTVGEGGHALALLALPETNNRLLGLDLDDQAIAISRARLGKYGKNTTLIKGSYANLQRVASEHGFIPADAVLFDLGMSSLQVENPEKGFSFARTGPLDMRFDREQELTAHKVVNQWSENQITKIIAHFGEEPRARRLARAIVDARPIETTKDLADLIGRTLGGSRKKKIHPATLPFQALRMAVNLELDNIRQGIRQAIGLMKHRGRMAVISYHSLEDRLVKNILREESSSCTCPPWTPECVCDQEARIRHVSRKVIKPKEEEIRVNPRSRSARLRVIERL